MAITRTAMTDDDGSGTTGTIINNAWKTELYNQIDAGLSATAHWTDLQVTTTGTVTDWNPGLVGNTVIYCVNTTALQITGFASTPAAFAGQRIRIVRGAAGEVQLFHYQHAASLVANRLVFPPPDPRLIVAVWGSAEFIYAQGLWQLRSFLT